MSVSSRAFDLSRLGWSGFAALLVACTGYDPSASTDGEPEFVTEAADVMLGTESGNPSEPAELPLGTESGNPDPGETTPETETGTESGNPTRPPPNSVSIDVEPAVPEAVDTSTSTPDQVPATDQEPVVDPGETMTDPPVVTNGPTQPMSTAPAQPLPAPDPTAPDAEQPVGAAAGVCEATTCQAEAESVAASYGATTTSPLPFEAWQCQAGNCVCSNATSSVTLTPSAELVCLVPGRLGCLFPSDAFEGCSTDGEGEAVCQLACAEVSTRQAEDALGNPVFVRASACTAAGCRYVLVSNDACFVAGSGLAPVGVDCTLSDEELLNSP